MDLNAIVSMYYRTTDRYVSTESKGWSKVSELSGVCDIWPVSTWVYYT